MAPPNFLSATAPGQKNPVAGHGSGSALPVGAQKPGSTGAHVVEEMAPIALDEVPAGQGTGELAPAAQKYPAVQSSQSVWPDLG